MKQKLLLLAFIGSFAACNPTQVVSTWRDPGTTISNPGVHKIVVAALIYDQGVRRQVEDYMSSLYPGKAVQSYTILGGDSLIGSNEAVYSQRLKDQGYDGIVIMRQVSEHTSQHYVPGTPGSFYTAWGGYWGPGWGTGWGPGWATYYNPGTPGYVATDRTWFVQVNAYSIPENKLIWTTNTKTTDPGGRVPLFEDVCNAVYKQMKKEKFLL